MEDCRRYYTREEEFLDHFYNQAAIAANRLNGEWQPNAACNDNVRKNREYFLSTGEQTALCFKGAGVFHDPDGFSSVQISLESSTRTVAVRVRKDDSCEISERPK